MFSIVKKEILKHLPKLIEMDKDKLITKRINKFCAMGVVVNDDEKSPQKKLLKQK